MKWRERKGILSDELSRLASLPAHEVLGVSADASVEQVRQAYRRLIKVYHPDRADPFMKRHNQEVSKIIIAAYRQLVGARLSRS